MSINFNSNYSMPQMDPDSYAQKYAEENNISLEDAKEELKAKYGDPSQQVDSGIFAQSSATAAVVPDASMDPDEFAQVYAEMNGLTLDEAKEKLSKMYGEPKQPQLDSYV